MQIDLDQILEVAMPGWDLTLTVDGKSGVTVRPPPGSLDAICGWAGRSDVTQGEMQAVCLSFFAPGQEGFTEAQAATWNQLQIVAIVSAVLKYATECRKNRPKAIDEMIRAAINEQAKGN